MPGTLFLIGAFPAWPHRRSWGYAPSGAPGGVVVIVIIIVVVLLLMGTL